MSLFRRWMRIAMGCGLALSALPTQAQTAAAPIATETRPESARCGVPNATTSLAAGAVRRDCEDTPELVAIPAGSFEMGDRLGNGYDYEKPVHKVKVEAFLMGRYEVTVGEWRACVAAAACPPPNEGNDAILRHPVAHVSWDDAQKYLAWLGRRTGRKYRLPSEAEWEYAARAGVDTQYTWGNIEIAICKFANTLDQSGVREHPQMTWYTDCDDGYAELAPVGSYPPNAWGLHDVIGNVWEWTADCWHPNYEGAPDTGRAWVEDGCSKRVNRGGGWGNHPRSSRVSARDADPHAAHSDGLGFRVARSIVYASGTPPPAAAGTTAP